MNGNAGEVGPEGPRSRSRGRNTSEYFVPFIDAGTALLHDHRVLHGISPVTKGSKYSLLLFIDMHAPLPPPPPFPFTTKSKRTGSNFSKLTT